MVTTEQGTPKNTPPDPKLISHGQTPEAVREAFPTSPPQPIGEVPPLEQIKSSADLKTLVEYAKNLEYTMDGGNVYMHNAQAGDSFWEAAKEIAGKRSQTILRVMVHRVAPNAKVPKHRDWVAATKHLGNSPCLERWHLPIQTNDNCVWWDEKDGDQKFPQGVWCGPVPYWISHTIVNNGTQDRIHIIVDLDSPKPVGSYGH
jgi:hypothetical protein